MSDVKKKQLCCGAIQLNPGISTANYGAMVFHNICVGFFLNGIELLQQILLSDPDYYNLAPESAIEKNANITLFDLIVRLLFAMLYGTLIDKLGRKRMIFIGYTLTGLGIALFPVHGYSENFHNLFPWYYFARFIYANGTSIILLMPFVADYIEDKSKGKATGINAVSLAAGFLLGTTIIKGLYNRDLDLKYICWIVGGIILVCGISYSALLKGGSEYYKVVQTDNNLESVLGDSESARESSTQAEPPKANFKQVKRALKERPWIKASFVFALLNGANLGIVSQILNLFVRSLSPSVSEDAGSQIVQYANIAGLVATIVFGFLLDYISPFYIGVFVLLLGSSGYSFAWVIQSPNDAALIFLAVAAGISYSSCQLLMNYLGFVHYPNQIRGRLYAMANFISFFGNLLITVIGGNLVEVDEYVPFYLIAGCCVIGLITFVVLKFTVIQRWEKTRKESTLEPFLTTVKNNHKNINDTSFKDQSIVSLTAN